LPDSENVLDCFESKNVLRKPAPLKKSKASHVSKQ